MCGNSVTEDRRGEGLQPSINGVYLINLKPIKLQYARKASSDELQFFFKKQPFQKISITND